MLAPNIATYHNNRGDAYYRKKDYDSAIADYTRAIKFDPNNGEIRQVLEELRQQLEEKRKQEQERIRQEQQRKQEQQRRQEEQRKQENENLIREKVIGKDCDTLGISHNPTIEEVKKGFREEMQKVHPDKNNSSKEATIKSQELNAARSRLLEYLKK
ncbi:hypothetical protein AGMMS49940_24160 [Spirochaetia bacterium]|nr:hypothetical protein AGMMS49940_24160 [Spirochaetia bacterium]